MKTHVLFIVGPTACGKSRIAVETARRLNGEIISADSMLVYRGMDIGTAKPSDADRRLIPHHLIDILEPVQEFSVFEYRELALQKISDIIARRKVPLVVGGTGLYVRALHRGLVKMPAPDIQIRRSLEAEAKSESGLKILYQRLVERDPLRAASIRPTDKRRIIRALEVMKIRDAVNRPVEEGSKSLADLGYSSLIIGLNKDRKILYRDIEKRVDEMFEKGLLDEVMNLSKKGLSQTASQAVGYKEIVAYLNGQISLEEAVGLIKRNSRHLAKRQMTWFRKDLDVHWIDIPEFETYDDTVARILAMIGPV